MFKCTERVYAVKNPKTNVPNNHIDVFRLNSDTRPLAIHSIIRPTMHDSCMVVPEKRMILDGVLSMPSVVYTYLL